jgi:hypothetical protein
MITGCPERGRRGGPETVASELHSAATVCSEDDDSNRIVLCLGGSRDPIHGVGLASTDRYGPTH